MRVAFEGHRASVVTVLNLLLQSPLWMAVLAITAALHVGFVIVIRRLIRRDSSRHDDRS